MTSRFTIKYLTAFLGMALLLVLSINLYAQEDEKKSKIRIKVTTDENGNSKTFEKEYNSKEEMLNDPDYKEFFGEEGNHFLKFHGDTSFDVDFDFDKGSFKSFFNFDSLKWDAKGGNSFFFRSDDDDDHVLRIDSSFSGNHFKFFFDDNGNNSFFNFDTDGSFEELREQLQQLKDNHDIDAFFFNDGDGDREAFFEKLEELKEKGFDGNGTTRSIIVIKKRVVIEDLKEEDEALKKLSKKRAAKLELDDFKYYPNPSTGKFSLRFRMEDEAPLSIKIYSLSGREIYGESYDSFSGSFRSEIDLAKHDKGIYLLEITQGNKVLNKKLILE